MRRLTYLRGQRCHIFLITVAEQKVGLVKDQHLQLVVSEMIGQKQDVQEMSRIRFGSRSA